MTTLLPSNAFCTIISLFLKKIFNVSNSTLGKKSFTSVHVQWNNRVYEAAFDKRIIKLDPSKELTTLNDSSKGS